MHQPLAIHKLQWMKKKEKQEPRKKKKKRWEGDYQKNEK